LAEGRDGHPEQAAAAPLIQRGDRGGRHIEHVQQADARKAPVGIVFDLRQQLDFVRARAANHGG